MAKTARKHIDYAREIPEINDSVAVDIGCLIAWKNKSAAGEIAHQSREISQVDNPWSSWRSTVLWKRNLQSFPTQVNPDGYFLTRENRILQSKTKGQDIAATGQIADQSAKIGQVDKFGCVHVGTTGTFKHIASGGQKSHHDGQIGQISNP